MTARPVHSGQPPFRFAPPGSPNSRKRNGCLALRNQPFRVEDRKLLISLSVKSRCFAGSFVFSDLIAFSFRAFSLHASPDPKGPSQSEPEANRSLFRSRRSRLSFKGSWLQFLILSIILAIISSNEKACDQGAGALQNFRQPCAAFSPRASWLLDHYFSAKPRSSSTSRRTCRPIRDSGPRTRRVACLLHAMSDIN